MLVVLSKPRGEKGDRMKDSKIPVGLGRESWLFWEKKPWGPMRPDPGVLSLLAWKVAGNLDIVSC